MTPKYDEAKTIRIRRANKSTPAELVIARDGKEYIVYILRESQLQNIVVDGVNALPQPR